MKAAAEDVITDVTSLTRSAPRGRASNFSAA